MKTITVRLETHNALREFNLSQVGQGIDMNASTVHDGQVSFPISEEVFDRLDALRGPGETMDDALLRAIKGEGVLKS